MAILQGMCSSFKQESWLGIHDLDTDTLKLALYTGSADLSQATTAYSVSTPGQVPAGSGYTTGGVTLTNVWSGASFTCRGGLIYNASQADRAIAVLDFGADKTASGTFTIQMPAATATTALLRFA
jgi:hypothetical protein